MIKYAITKECVENGDINAANKHFKIAIKKLDDVESYCRNIDDFDNGSKIIGTIMGTIMQLGWFIVGEAINLTIYGLRMHKGNKKFNDDINKSFKKFASQIDEEDSGKSIMGRVSNLIKMTNTMSEYRSDLDTNYTDSQIRANRAYMTAQYSNIVLAIANIVKMMKENKQIRIANSIVFGKVPVGNNTLRDRMILLIMKTRKNMEDQITIMNNYFK